MTNLATLRPRRRRSIRLMVSTRIAASRANRCFSGDTASITVEFVKKAQSFSSCADILASRTRDGTMKKQQNLDHGAWDAVTSGAVEIVDRAHMKSRIERGDRLRVKLGLDPTKPDIHLGHTVPLRALRRYQQHGHQAVLIIGDWTARIGDPSGQNVTRPQLTKEEVDAAAQTYLDQAWKILDEAETEVRFQSEWFDKMPLLEGLDGVQKMSKSLDNYIGIAEPPSVMYRKAMSVPDHLIVRYLQLVTDADQEELAAEERALGEGENPRGVKQRLAERIVRQCHPDAQPGDYREESGGFKSTGPTTVDIEPGERSIAQLFLDAGLVASKSEARRLVGQRGLTINGQPVGSADDKVTPTDGMLLQRGLHRVVRLKVS